MNKEFNGYQINKRFFFFTIYFLLNKKTFSISTFVGFKYEPSMTNYNIYIFHITYIYKSIIYYRLSVKLKSLEFLSLYNLLGFQKDRRRSLCTIAAYIIIFLLRRSSNITTSTEKKRTKKSSSDMMFGN